MQDSPVLIFDLDDTVLSVNSFPIWVWHMLFGRFGDVDLRNRTVLSFKTAIILAERKILGITHLEAKHRLQTLWQEAIAEDSHMSALGALNEKLYASVRPQLKDLLQAVKEQKFDAVLATAAVSDYAEDLGQRLGFQHIIATPRDTNAPENSGQHKCDNMLAFLVTQKWADRRRVFFTDHREDLPLIRQSHLVFWFGTNDDLMILRQNLPHIMFIACQPLSSAEIIKIVQG